MPSKRPGVHRTSLLRTQYYGSGPGHRRRPSLSSFASTNRLSRRHQTGQSFRGICIALVADFIWTQGNVLVNHKLRALLCDFGLAKALDGTPHGFTMTDGFKGSIPWCSPEVLSENSPRTTASDMWAWALLVREVSLVAGQKGDLLKCLRLSF